MDKLLDPTHPVWKVSKIAVVLAFIFAVIKFNNVDIDPTALLAFGAALLGADTLERKLVQNREKKIIENERSKREI